MTENNRTNCPECKEPTLQHQSFIISEHGNDCGDDVHRDEKQAFSERLKAILDKAGFTPEGKGRQEELGKLFGVSQRGAGKWLTGESVPGISTHLPEIVDKFKDYGASIEWLLMGNPDFDPDRPYNRRVYDGIEGDKINYGLRKIPVAGATQLNDNEHWSILDRTHEGGFIVFPIKNSSAYAMRCDGDAMAPRIKNGEFVVIDVGSKAEPGDEVLITHLDGGLKVKVFLYERDNMLYFMSINNSHALSIAAGDIKEIHPIAGVFKKSLFVSD
ncbi:MAG: LexA family transcriptional regulator [Methylococcaceae bacterium]